MRIISKSTYRSEGRKVNQDDDRMRIILDMTREEYYMIFPTLQKHCPEIINLRDKK